MLCHRRKVITKCFCVFLAAKTEVVELPFYKSPYIYIHWKGENLRLMQAYILG